MTNLDSIFKIRDIILPTKVRLVKAMVFPALPGSISPEQLAYWPQRGAARDGSGQTLVFYRPVKRRLLWCI